MKPFLKYVAEDLLAKFGTNLSHLCVVFPNKRAALFLNEYLAQAVQKPLWSPVYLTISDLFRRHSPRQVADPIKLVADLHRCFVQITGSDETLDHFYSWGQLLLADFDDLDKNMADADRVFANLSNIHELDDTTYLTPEQRAALQQFFMHFTDQHPTLLKQRFLRLWSHMGHIYHSFNEQLAAQQLAYEGALYREVAEKIENSRLKIENCHADENTAQPNLQSSIFNLQSSIFNLQSYAFVGFSMLGRAEQMLFQALQRQGKALFYWDFDHYYMPAAEKNLPSSTLNEAGHFIAQYLDRFPNELDTHDPDIYRQFSQPKTVSYVAAPTENLQARYVSQWLRQVTPAGQAPGPDTAIVLCREELLPAVLHSLPDEVQKVNITTGYPLIQTPIASLVGQLLALHTAGWQPRRQSYRLHHVSAVLRHPYAVYASAQAPTLLNTLTSQHQWHPTPRQLIADEGTALLFTPTDSPCTLMGQLCRIVSLVARQGATRQADPLFQESAFRMYTLLQRLHALMQSGQLGVSGMATVSRLLRQLVAGASVPFHGEPVEGLQVMGVLETRCLDFSHVLLLSTNDGNMPRGTAATSFIPYSLRRAYGLTTADHQVSIYSYYFHRLLQRARHVTVAYCSSTADGRSGQMSRFMLQLLAEGPHRISRHTLQAPQAATPFSPPTIEKTPQVMQQLQQRLGMLTPTAVSRYMRCPLQFYYSYVCGLREPQQPSTDADGIDGRIFGNIFHEAARSLYEPWARQGHPVSTAQIDSLLQQPVALRRAVDAAIAQELPGGGSLGGLQLISREVLVHYLALLLRTDRQLAPFTIAGLEQDVAAPLAIPHMAATIGGRIDRIDLLTTPDGRQQLRVVDYKTGSRRLQSLPGVDAIFAQDSPDLHPADYYLQTFIYSCIVSRHGLPAATGAPQVQPGTLPVAPALLFIQHTQAPGSSPVLCFGREPIADVAPHSAAFWQHLEQLACEMFSPQVPFAPTPFRQRCTACPYRQLCSM